MMKSLFYIVGGISCALILVETFVRLYSVPTYLLPRPSEVFEYLCEEFFDIFYEHLMNTIMITFGGLLLGIFFGVCFAVIAVLYKNAHAIILPSAIGLRTTPLIALIPILVVWFGNGIVTKTVAVAFIVFFPVLINVSEGLKSLEKDEVLLFKSFHATSLQILFYLRVFKGLPHFFSSLKIVGSLGVLGTIIVEFSSSNTGLGFLIMQFSYNLNMVGMFATLTLCMTLSLVLYGLIFVLEKRLVFWRQNNEQMY